MNWSNTRLGMILGTNSACGPDGRLHMNHANGRLIEAISERTGGARICVPVLPQVNQNMTHVLPFQPEDIVKLPPLGSTMHAQRYFFSARRILREFAKSVDVLFIRFPFQLPRALLKLPRPRLLHIAGDPTEAIKISSDYRGVKRFAAERFAQDGIAVMRRLAQDPETRVATNGAEMWEKLHCRAGRVVVSSCLYQNEMVPKDSLDLHDPPRVLFVGYIRPEKGVDILLDAFDKVRATRKLSLTIVGGHDRVTLVGQEIRKRLEASPYREDIRETGMVDFGEELFELYRSHDLYVLPSRSEGTPRSVVEARAFGCPPIATRVGGIPTSITDGENGLLIPPNDPTALAEAIQRLLDDDALRRRLAQTGIDEGPRYSLESFADQLVGELEQLVPQASLQSTP